MDDSSFDNYIRKKMEDYESSSYNPDAFSNIQARLATTLYIPWHIKYRTELLVAATLILFTLFNIYWISPKFSVNENEQVQTPPHSSDIIDSLNSIIRELSDKAAGKIYIIDPIEKHSVEKGEWDEGIPHKYKLDETTKNSNLKLFLGSKADLAPDVFNKLKEWNVIALDGDRAWLVIFRQKQPLDHRVDNTGYDPELLPVHKPISIAVKLEPSSVPSRSHREISGKMRNSLEKHYFTGIGIHLAPYADLSIGNFTVGSGVLIPRIGLVADWVMSPQFSVETGVGYSTPKFTLNNNFQRLKLQDVDAQIGTLQSVQIAVRTLSIPVNVKFRRWLTAKNQMVFRIGYTPYFAFRNQYVYNYSPFNQPPESDLTITTIEQMDEKRFYGSTLTASAGITRILKDNKKIEASLYFENSVGNVGDEKVEMKLFGIRTAYWFRLK